MLRAAAGPDARHPMLSSTHGVLSSQRPVCYAFPMDRQFKAVVLHGFSNEEALEVLRAVRAIGQAGPSPAFATTTASNLEWKLGELLEHLAEEHKAMTERQKGG